ncbi:hypothetical protein SUGI_0851040 [Cryptomeria japonica]|nr:hypothetical protein SUGI_0851040 [Cryptomeria japonica]
MADRGLEHSWVRLAALLIALFHHLSSQFYEAIDGIHVCRFLRLWPHNNENKEAAYYVYATIISLCFILLILLLACATIAGKSIERIVTKKISLVLRGEEEFCADIAEKTEDVDHQNPQPHRHSCWRNVRNDVSSADQHHNLHHVHDHSCLETVEKAMLRAANGDEDHYHSCWRTVKHAELREEKEEEIRHCCRRTIEDSAVSSEKAEEKHYRRHCHYCWRTVEDAVLKAWIIVRAYSVQAVLARSPLTASAAVILTIQIVVTIAGGIAKELKVETKDEENRLEIIATVVQCIFIFLGWSLIILRWATAVAYHQISEKDSWRSGLRVEDFWTRYLVDLQEASESRLQQAELLDKKIDQLVSKKGITGSVPGILLSAAIRLQWLLVSFSKACWLASVMIFHNKSMGKLFSCMFPNHLLFVFEEYPKYERILADVQILGESPKSLWIAHRMSIEKAKSFIIQGNQDGEYNCDDLVDFLLDKKMGCGLGLSCLDPYKPQTGLNFLCKKKPTEGTRQPDEDSDVEKDQSRGQEDEPISDCSKSHDFPPGAVKNCFKAYSQAWEIIDFVEEADSDVDEITSEAADKYFQALQNKVNKEDIPARNFTHATPECVRAALEELKEECKSKEEPLESENCITALVYALAVNEEEGKEQGRPDGSKGNDFIEWRASASCIAVYNLCSTIECNDGTDVSELLKELERCLAGIINECLEKAQHLLLLQSKEWALKRDEKRMGKALYTAGKAKAIMEKLMCNIVAIVSCR